MTDTKLDQSGAAAPESSFRQAMRFLAFILACLLGLAIIAFTAGFVAGMTEDGAVSWADIMAVGVGIFLLAGVAWLLKRTLPDVALPSSPRMRSTRLILYVTIGLSVLLGIALAMLSDATGADVASVFADGSPLPQPVAIFLLAGLVVVTLLSIRWHMLLDEHERAAYDFGGIAALYAYFMLSAGWWLLWRGGMVIPPDGYAIFWTTMVVWALGWLARRFF